jgi:ribulose 1,5-bisphosphate synthetase/thiazole synthase
MRSCLRRYTFNYSKIIVANRWNKSMKMFFSSEAIVEREKLHYDVITVGAGPAGLAAAIRLKQLSNEKGVRFDSIPSL